MQNVIATIIIRLQTGSGVTNNQQNSANLTPGGGYRTPTAPNGRQTTPYESANISLY